MNQPETVTPVYLIDASIYIFQSHFSPNVECYDQQGSELSALYGFTQFILQFLRRVQPGHVAVAHDESLFCGFRHELCENYKSNRELPDENLEMQLDACSEICALLGLQSYASKVYEADDIIGTLATRIRQEGESSPAGINVHIVSRDKDLAQLLAGEGDCLWDYSGNRKRFRPDILDEYGVHPEQFPDYLGLIGDSVDCISGVPGVGPVKAKELLQRFHSLENIYQNLDKIGDLPLRGAGRLADLLNEHRELAELSKVLATIVCNVDDPKEKFSKVTLEALQTDTIDEVELRKFLDHYQFNAADSNRILSLSGRINSA